MKETVQMGTGQGGSLGSKLEGEVTEDQKR